jgi:mannosyltransferase OCH1-like enzyme
MNIPQILVQTSRSPPPQYVIDQLKEYLPDTWKYQHFTDDDILLFFMENPDPEFPDLIAKFYSLQYGEHRSDLFRYYYLYKKGGVYIDSDAMLQTIITDLTREHTFFSVCSSYFPSTIFQGIIGSIPEHPILYKAIKNIYETENRILIHDFHLLCRNLYSYVHEHTCSPEPHLYQEIYGNDQEAHIIDDQHNLLAIHYYSTKIIPLKK